MVGLVVGWFSVVGGGLGDLFAGFSWGFVGSVVSILVVWFLVSSGLGIYSNWASFSLIFSF